MCAMSPRLLRPLASGVHPEALDWRSRVSANGGSVSASSLKAVSQFCIDIEKTAGLRAKLTRVNLFCGNNFAACQVPLYRSTSRGGTVVGNTLDTSHGSPSFDDANYTETGTGGGLVGDGSSRYLNTGVAQNFNGNVGHCSVYHRATFASAAAAFIRVSDGVDDIIGIDYGTGVAGIRGFWGTASAAAFSNTDGGHIIASRTGASLITNYRNGTNTGSPNTSPVSPVLQTPAFFVFASNQNGTPAIFTAARLQGYSIGDALSAADALAFSTAMIAFQTALGRN